MHSQVTTTLTASVNGMRYTRAPMLNVCVGDTVNFVCKGEGSRILTWSSDQYIGPGGMQLEFTEPDENSEERVHEVRSKVDPNVVATFTSMDNTRLTSVLRIIVASPDNTLSSTIVCDQRNANGTATSVILYYLGKGICFYLHTINML